MSGSCLICGGSTTLTSVTPIVTSAGCKKISNNTGVCSVDGIKRICLLHKILAIPLSKCMQFLEMFNGGQDGMTFCSGCGPLVEKGEEQVAQMDILEAQLVKVRYKMMTLLNQKNKGQGQMRGTPSERQLMGCFICRVVTSTSVTFLTSIMLSKCLEYLEMPEEVQDGMTFCGWCGPLVDEGHELVGRIDKLDSQKKGVQYKIMTLLQNSQQLHRANGQLGQGQKKDFRSSLIREINRRGLPFTVNAKGSMRMRGVSSSGNVKVGSRDESMSKVRGLNGDQVEGTAGIGIITRTPSMSTSNQGQDEGQPSGRVVVEGERQRSAELFPEIRDPSSTIKDDNLGVSIPPEVMDTEVNENDLCQGQDKEKAQGNNQWKEEDDEVQILEEFGPGFRKPSEVSASLGNAELVAQVGQNNLATAYCLSISEKTLIPTQKHSNKVKVAPLSSISTGSNRSRVRMSPLAPKKVNVGTTPRDADGVTGSPLVEQVGSLEEEGDQNGVGIDARTTSISTPNQDQDQEGNVEETGEGQEVGMAVAVANHSRESQPQFSDIKSVIKGQGQVMMKKGEIGVLLKQEKEEKKEPKCGIEDELDELFNEGDVEEVMVMEVEENNLDQDQVDDGDQENINPGDEIEILEESEVGIGSKQLSRAVSTSFRLLNAEFDTQKNANNPNQVRLTPSTLTNAGASTSQVYVSPLTSPLAEQAPRNIRPPPSLLRLRDHNEYSEHQSGNGVNSSPDNSPETMTQPRPELTPKEKPQGYKNYQCVLCNIVFHTPPCLGRHYSLDHGDVTTWPCYVCDEGFDTQIELYRHRRDIHKNLPINAQKAVAHPNGRTNINPISGNNSKENSVERSQRRKPATASGSSRSTPNSKPGPRRFQHHYFCTLCDTRFTGRLGLMAHQAKKHGNNPIWDCSVCGKECKTRIQLYYHRRTVHKNLPINQTSDSPSYGINRGSKIKRDFGNPGRRVRGRMSNCYICLLCDKDCKTRTNIIDHYAYVHNNPKEWPCFACNRVFDIKNSLYVHRWKTHQNLPMAGRAPGNSLAAPGRTQLNVKVRVGKKKITTLSGKTGWNFHCKMCGVDCKSGIGVSRHYQKVHPTLPKRLECSKCYKIFSSYNTLFTHKKYNHKEKDDDDGERKKISSQARKSRPRRSRDYDSDETYVP